MYKVSLEGITEYFEDSEIAKKLRQCKFVDNFHFQGKQYDRKIYIELVLGEKKEIKHWIEELSISDVYGIYLTDAHWVKVRKRLFK